MFSHLSVIKAIILNHIEHIYLEAEIINSIIFVFFNPFIKNKQIHNAKNQYRTTFKDDDNLFNKLVK